MFGSLLADLFASNVKHKQSDVLQGLPAGLAGLISTIKQLQSSWSMVTCSYDSSASCSCSVVHEALPGPVYQAPLQREAWLLGTGGLRRKREMSWRRGLKRAFKLGGWFNSN